MILFAMRENEQTVLILGAGASADYGLPIGGGLRDWILRQSKAALISQLMPEDSARARWRRGEDDDESTYQDHMAGMIRGKVAAFISAFGRTGDVTIDEFLRDHVAHAELGRLAIAHCLLTEQDKALELNDLGTGCYNPIRRWVVDAKDRSQALDRLKIINFNYDRTFELLLATMLASGSHVGATSPPNAISP